MKVGCRNNHDTKSATPFKIPSAQSSLYRRPHWVHLGQDYVQQRWGVKRNDGHSIKCGQNYSLTLLLGNINSSLIIVKNLAIIEPFVHYHEYRPTYSLGYHNRSMQWLEEIAILKERFTILYTLSKQAVFLPLFSAFWNLFFSRSQRLMGKTLKDNALSPWFYTKTQTLNLQNWGRICVIDP